MNRPVLGLALLGLALAAPASSASEPLRPPFAAARPLSRSALASMTEPGVIRIPRGVWRTTETIRVPSGTVLEGVGRPFYGPGAELHGSWILHGGHDGPAVELFGAQSVTIRGLGFCGGQAAGYDHAGNERTLLSLQSRNEPSTMMVRVSECTFALGGVGIRAGRGAGMVDGRQRGEDQNDRVTVEESAFFRLRVGVLIDSWNSFDTGRIVGCRFWNCAESGIRSRSGGMLHVSSCDGGGDHPGAALIDLVGDTNVSLIERCQDESAGYFLRRTGTGNDRAVTTLQSCRADSRVLVDGTCRFAGVGNLFRGEFRLAGPGARYSGWEDRVEGPKAKVVTEKGAIWTNQRMRHAGVETYWPGETSRAPDGTPERADPRVAAPRPMPIPKPDAAPEPTR